MSKLIINYKKCPDCGNRLKRYYHYCGDCGREDIINWWAMALLVVIVIIAGFAVYQLVMNSISSLGQ